MTFIKVKPQSPNRQGWKQFLTARKEMLDAYETAKIKGETSIVKVNHGKVAEAEFRKWLTSFLPKRYGVASGYIISQGLSENDNLPHYDVIIYDQFESPILWSDENPDNSDQGKSLAIPAQFVKGVIEIKSTFNPRNVKDAIIHLSELKTLLSGTNSKSELSVFLPDDFFCYTVFFEYHTKDLGKVSSLNNFLEGNSIRGFKGGLILKYEKDVSNSNSTGSISVSASREMLNAKADSNSEHFHFDGVNYFMYSQMFSVPEFSRFAFQIISLLNPNFGVSFYAFGAPDAKWLD